MAEIISGTKRKAAHVANLGPPKVVPLQIDRVIGLSTPNNGTVACSPSNADLFCYTAGSFAIVYSRSAQLQLRLLRSTTSNAALSCVAWSGSGEHIAAGEAGTSPSVTIWEWSSSKCLHELKGHKSSLASVRFSPDGKLLLTAGGAHDGQLCIWDWRAGSVLWRQNVASELSSAVFTEDSSCVLAVGKGIFKAWSVNNNPPAARTKAASSGNSNSLTLTPRPVTLRELQRSNFVDVCMAPCLPSQPPGNNGVYALVESGVLVLMRPTGRTIDKSVNLQVKSAFGLAAAPTQVAAACSQGVVRLFSSKTLTFRATLPRFVAKGQAPTASEDFPDARGCSFTPETEDQLVVVYADMSMIVWNIQDITKVTCVVSLAAHSSCIWDVCPISVPAIGSGGTLAQLPVPSQCATCSADGTVRLWNLSADTAPGTGRLLAAAVDDGGKPSVQLRCMRTSPDGRHICLGDQAGNLRVYDSVTYKLVAQQEAHDDEVLCLDYSPLVPGSSCLVASGSRDMLIHIFDAQNGYELLETLDDHTAAVTGVRFTGGGKGIVSCGADRSIIFRVLGGGADGRTAAYHIETLPHSVLYDLAVDPLDQYVFTTGQDGLLRQWDVASGNLQQTLAPEAGAGEPIKLYIDPGGVVLICCHADGCLRLHHLASGQLLWRAWGHAEMVAAASLSSDFTRMVSVGGDGCVIVWQLPEQLVQEVQAAVARVAAAKMRLETASKQHKQQVDKQAAAEQPANAWVTRRQPACEAGPAVAAASPAQHADSAGHVGYATPPTCSILSSSSNGPGTSDSGISSTLLRVRQGQPLVSTDKLPKWARSPNAGGPLSPPSKSGHGAAQQKQPLQNKWLAPRPANKGKWQMAQELVMHSETGSPIVAKIDEGGCRRLSLDSDKGTTDGSRAHGKLSDTDELLEGNVDNSLQLHSSVWAQDDNMVVIQDWDDSSLVQYEGPGDTEDGAAVAEEPLAAVGGDFTAQLPQQTPAGGPAGTGVVRDLFKEHFSSLGGVDPCNSQRQSHEFRQSLSAMFKAGRASLGGLQLRSQGLSSAGGVPASRSAEEELETAAPPMRLSAYNNPTAALDAADLALQQQQQLGAAASDGEQAGTNNTGDEQLMAAQVSPKRRWRHGKMDAELAGMRERLANLQALYQQQMRQRQLSPRRGRSCSSSDDQMQHAAELAVQQQGCSSEPGSATKKSRTDQDSAAACVQVEVLANNGSQARSSVDVSAATSATDDSSSTPSDGASADASAQPGLGSNAASTAIGAAPSGTSGAAPPPLPLGPVPAAALTRVAGRPASYAAAVAAPASLGPQAVQQEAAVISKPAAAVTAVMSAAENDTHTELGHSAAARAATGVASVNRKPELVQSAQAAADLPDSTEQTAEEEEPGDAAAAASGMPSAAVDLPPASPVMQATDDSGLLAQLLSDSPELPVRQLTSSPACSDSAAAGAAAAAATLSAPNPLCMAAVFEAAAEEPPGSHKGEGSVVSSSTASPTLPSASWLQSRSAASLGDSMYRVSIGASIPAAGGASNTAHSSLSGEVAGKGAGSPTRCSLQLKILQAAAAAASSSDSFERTKPELDNTNCAPETLVATEAAAAIGDEADAVEVGSAHQQQQALDLEISGEAADAGDVSCTMMSDEEARHGVTITPHGQHVVWPGWGPEGAWEGITPSPVNPSIVSNLQATLAAEVSAGAGPAVTDSSATADALDGVAGCGVAAGEPRYWVQRNPCFDMTPLGSTPGSVMNSSNGRTSYGSSIPFDAVSDTAGGHANQLTAATDVNAQQHHLESNPHQQQQQQQQRQEVRGSEDPQCSDVGAEQTEHCAGKQQQEQHCQRLSGDVEPCAQQKSRQLPLHQQQQQPQHIHAGSMQQQVTHPAAALLDASFTTTAGGSTPVSPTAGFGHISTPASGACSSPATPSTAGGKNKGQLRREKAAAKAALKAAKAAQDGHESPGFSSPGSSMMSLLQRIKRTMPSMKSRPSSSTGGPSVSGGLSCAGATACNTHSPAKGPSPRLSADGGDVLSTAQQSGSRQQSGDHQHAVEQAASSSPISAGTLGAWMRDSMQYPKWRRSSDDAAAVSADDVKLDVAQVFPTGDNSAAPPDSKEAQVQHGREVHVAEQQRADAVTPVAAGSAITSAAAAAGSRTVDALSAVKRRTAAQLAASVEQFKQSVQEMQQLWMQLQSLSLDEQDASELQQLLTPPHKAAAAAACTGGGGSSSTGRAAGPPATLGSPSCEAVPTSKSVLPPAASLAPSSTGAAGPQQQQSAEPVQLVKQMLQEELLHSIWGLHATVTGGGKIGGTGLVQLQAGASGSPPQTPLQSNCSTSPLQPWQLNSMHSAQQQQAIESYSSSPLGAMRTPGKQLGGDDVTTADSSGGGSWQTHHNSSGQPHPGRVSCVVSAGGMDVAPGSPAWSSYSMSQGGVSLEEMTSRICEQYTETLLRKLEERRQQKQGGHRHSPTKQQQRQLAQHQLQHYSEQPQEEELHQLRAESAS